MSTRTLFFSIACNLIYYFIFPYLFFQLCGQMRLFKLAPPLKQDRASDQYRLFYWLMQSRGSMPNVNLINILINDGSFIVSKETITQVEFHSKGSFTRRHFAQETVLIDIKAQGKSRFKVLRGHSAGHLSNHKGEPISDERSGKTNQHLVQSVISFHLLQYSLLFLAPHNSLSERALKSLRFEKTDNCYYQTNHGLKLQVDHNFVSNLGLVARPLLTKGIYIYRIESEILTDFRLTDVETCADKTDECIHVNSRERCVLEHTVFMLYINFTLPF